VNFVVYYFTVTLLRCLFLFFAHNLFAEPTDFEDRPVRPSQNFMLLKLDQASQPTTAASSLLNI